MTYGDIIKQLAETIRSIEDPRARRFVAEQAMLRGLGIRESALVAVMDGTNDYRLVQSHPACVAADAEYDAMLASLRMTA